MTAKGGCRNGTEVVHVNRVHVGPRLGRVPKDVDLGEGQLIIFSILGEEDDTIVAHHHTVPRVLETYTVELAKAIVIGFGHACRNVSHRHLSAMREIVRVITHLYSF